MSAWLGGSILVELPTFAEMWCGKDEYAEYGPRIALQKCYT